MEIIIGTLIALTVLFSGNQDLINHMDKSARESQQERIQTENTLKYAQEYCKRYNCNETIIYNRIGNKWS